MTNTQHITNAGYVITDKTVFVNDLSSDEWLRAYFTVRNLVPRALILSLEHSLIICNPETKKVYLVWV
jgi:hypothetical protein